MTRGIGEFAPIQEFVPEWMAVIIALLTQLGDLWFVTLLLAVLYWTQVERQDDILLVAGTLVAGIGLYRFFKHTFELPRPDQPLLDPELLPWIIRPLYEATAFASGYGFPSGHATVTTIVYFGLATVLTVSTRRVRYIAAALIVCLVGFTRVALGVHFVVDIVAGIALGGAILALVFRGIGRIARDRVTVLFGIAIIANGLYLFESGVNLESVIMVGVALGLFGGWQLVLLARAVVGVEQPSNALKLLALRGGLAVVAIGPLFLALEMFPLLSGEPYPLGGATGIAGAIVILLPITRHSPHVRQFLSALSFWSTAALSGVRALFRRSTWQRLWKELGRLWRQLRD